MSDPQNTGLQSGNNWNPILGSAESVSAREILGQLEQLMPFLVGMTRDERRRLTRAGRVTRPFIADALATAEANPGIVPRSIDLVDMRARLESLDRIREVRQRLSALTERVVDTEGLLASRLYGSARAVYAVMKTPATVPGLGERRRQLQARFKRRKGQRSSEELAPLPSAV